MSCITISVSYTHLDVYKRQVLEGNVEEVKLTNKLKSHPVCLTTTGEVSTSMEKVINAMPTDEKRCV